MQYIIFVSHTYYGGCYIGKNDQLTKDRSEAIRFDNFEDLDNVKQTEAHYQKKFKYKCYAQTTNL